MAKNIVICADGTGNTAIKGRGTNVFKLYEAVDENGHRFPPYPIQQVAIYHDGVGTESLKWVRLFAGAFGWGLSRNVKQLYGELARVYEPGDHLFLFGFSRGAFTVRTLAGLIIACGILDLAKCGSNEELTRRIRAAYNEYRRKYQTRLSKWIHGTHTLDVAALRNEFSVPIPGFTDPGRPIVDFIGVWDTVDAVGLPFGIANVINDVVWRFKFPNKALSGSVGRACHALALDEARASFAPVLWDEDGEDSERPRIEQVWFAGVHSNVGGGYPRQGVSLVALDWMMTQAEACGLRFLADERLYYRGAADVNDKRYDSRAGVGTFYRWTPRDVAALCGENHVEPKVHRTVFERVARNTEGYAPGSLPPRSRVITTQAPEAVRESIEAVVAEAFGGGPPLLQRVRGWSGVAALGYWLMVIGALLLAAFAVWTVVSDSAAHAPTRRAMFSAFANLSISSHWIQVLGRVLIRHLWLGPTLALGLLLQLFAAARIDTTYSEFWHRVRPKLKAAM
jgi:uncharacterized protein (DUF2235 family)